MVTHRRIVVTLGSFAVALLVIVAACNKVPLLAPTGSVITLLPQTTSVSLNSQVTIVATVIENGTASAGTGSGSGTTTTRTGAGNPVQNGTVVTFTTTVGQVQPSQVQTHNGQATTTLVTGGTSGTATITAYSGGASASIQLKVGTAAVKTVNITSVPQALGPNGGSAAVIATVLDDGGAPVGGVPVTFATDKGSVSPPTVTTDSNGNASATLATTATANVTATAGSVTSGKVTVSVGARGLSGFQASPSSANAGTAITFTVTPATGANLSNVRVDFGDGNSRNLGAIGSPTTVAYAYSSPGNYTATATSTDANGETGSLSTSVIVGSLQITLSANPNPSTPLTPTTFAVSGASSAQVDHFLWTFDDGSAQQTTTGPQITHTFTSRGIKTVQVDVFGVSGGKLGTAVIQIDVQ